MQFQGPLGLCGDHQLWGRTWESLASSLVSIASPFVVVELYSPTVISPLFSFDLTLSYGRFCRNPQGRPCDTEVQKPFQSRSDSLLSQHFHSHARTLIALCGLQPVERPAFPGPPVLPLPLLCLITHLENGQGYAIMSSVPSPRQNSSLSFGTYASLVMQYKTRYLHDLEEC